MASSMINVDYSESFRDKLAMYFSRCFCDFISWSVAILHLQFNHMERCWFLFLAIK